MMEGGHGQTNQLHHINWSHTQSCTPQYNANVTTMYMLTKSRFMVLPSLLSLGVGQLSM